MFGLGVRANARVLCLIWASGLMSVYSAWFGPQGCVCFWASEMTSVYCVMCGLDTSVLCLWHNGVSVLFLNGAS